MEKHGRDLPGTQSHPPLNFFDDAHCRRDGERVGLSARHRAGQKGMVEPVAGSAASPGRARAIFFTGP